MSSVPLTRFISQSGLCSRRAAEALIRAGHVTVNGKPAELGMKAGDDDVVTVKGRPLEKTQELVYIALNKPIGYTCTNRHFKGEKNIFDLVKTPQRLHVVGRLDKNSRGLVLLTNDGELTAKLTHPRYQHEKEYLVSITNDELRITNEQEQEVALKLKAGVEIGEGDGVVKAKSAVYDGDGVFRLVLTSGKKRQLRRMFESLGLRVRDLQRVRIGHLELGDLPEGQWLRVSKSDV